MLSRAIQRDGSIVVPLDIIIDSSIVASFPAVPCLCLQLRVQDCVKKKKRKLQSIGVRCDARGDPYISREQKEKKEKEKKKRDAASLLHVVFQRAGDLVSHRDGIFRQCILLSRRFHEAEMNFTSVAGILHNTVILVVPRVWAC